MDDQQGISSAGLRDHCFAGPVTHRIFQRLSDRSIGSGVHHSSEPVHIPFEHAKLVDTYGACEALNIAPRPAVAYDVDAVDPLQIRGIQPSNEVR